MTVKTIFKDLRKILVFNPSFIGDAVLTTPLVTALQKLFPEADVVLCVRPECAPLFEGLDFKVIVFDKRKTDSGLTGLIRFSENLKREKFDIVLSPHKSLRSSLILKLSGIPFRIGFKEATGKRFYTQVIQRDMVLHEAERNLSFLSQLSDGCSLEETKRLGENLRTFRDVKYADIVCNYMRIAAKGRKIVGLNAGSVWNTKRWPVEYYAEIAEMLHKAGYAVAVFGGPADNEVNMALKEMLYMEYFDYVNKTPFRQIPAVISGLALLITNDSAPLHIAVSQNIPVVAIFGPTVPALGFAPYDNRSLICEIRGLPCRPCGLHGGKRCPEKHFKCMLDLLPEQIFNAALKIVG
ncbi:MAG: glycosyltransferase family 9 protein [Deferribacteraceae bacterium]|jgi:heptosyltransferase-2|nr:glycosyltransferase family 9 protein [Deferribacteraceae bacterium]